jgi:hypothetical protein
MHEVIEDHHVSLLQAPIAAKGNEIRRSGPGANQIDGCTHPGILTDDLMIW